MSLGFTLVEMMVAVSIFLLVVTTGIGGLLTMFTTYQDSQGRRMVNDSLAASIDQLAREIRTGYNYHCFDSSPGGSLTNPQDCPDGATGLAFESAEGDPGRDDDQIIYRFNETSGVLERSDSSGASFLPLTSPALEIDTFRFFVSGADSGDMRQPLVTVLIAGTHQSQSGSQPFSVQTSISQRLLDLPPTQP